MSTRRISLSRPSFRVMAFGLAGLLAGVGLQQVVAQAPLRITGAALAGDKVMMNWTSNSYSYEVQTTESLAAPNWRPVLATSRTNGLIPLSGSSGFFRVVGPRLHNLVMTMTNLADGTSMKTTLLSRTNADMVFDGPTNWNGFSHFRIVYPAAELEKFDVAFDNAGGFTFVPYTGGAVTQGGWWTITNGPGVNDFTYNGFLTNGSGMYAFSTVISPSSAKGEVSAQEDSSSLGGLAGEIGKAADSAKGGWDSTTCAGEWLACQGACFTKGVACAFIFKGVECNWTQNVQWTNQVTTTPLGTSTNWLSVCNGKCDPQCK